MILAFITNSHFLMAKFSTTCIYGILAFIHLPTIRHLLEGKLCHLLVREMPTSPEHSFYAFHLNVEVGRKPFRMAFPP